MADEVKLKIGGDTTELEKALSNAIKKIQAEADKLRLTPAGSKSAPLSPASNRFQESLQTARSQQQRIRDDRDAAEIANRALVQKQRELEKISKYEASSVGNKKQEAYWADQKNRAEKEYNTIIAARNRLAPPSGGGGGGRNNVPPGASAAGFGGAIGKGGITSIGGLASAIGIPGMVIGGAITAIAAGMAGEGIRQFYAQAGNRSRTIGSEVFNTQGQAGQLLSSAFSGNSAENIAFAPQRARASQIAYQTESENINSPFRLFKDLFSNREELAEVFGVGTAATNRVSQEKRNKEQADIQAQQEEALKQGPEGKITTEVNSKYIRDWRRNLDFQRQTGLSEGEFRGFLGGVNGAGFQDETGMGMASNIAGSGGSTRAATGNAAFALQMGRQFDLTNAGQAIGAISGQLGGAQQSKDALIAIQAEGTRIGLNRSDMREENRKFVEMAANVISQSNASSAAGVDQVLDTLTKFMSGSNTVAGLQAGQSAYEMYQRQSNVQSGPSAVMRAAGMRRDPTLGTLTERQRAILSMMPESEITPDSPVIQNMAGGDPKKVQDIVNNYHKVIGESLFVNPTTDSAITKLRKAKMAAGPFANGEAYKQLGLAQGGAAGEASLEQMFAGATEKQRLAGVNALASGDYKGLTALQEEIKSQAESKGSPRGGDQMEKQQAEASRMANELFLSIQKSIEPAATVTAQFTANINALVVAMRGGDVKAIAAAQSNLYNFGAPQTQQPVDQTHANVGGGPPTMTVDQIKEWQKSH